MPRRILAYGTGTGSDGPELHESGDLAVDERGVPNREKYVVDEGPKYRSRDTIHSTPGARDMDDQQGGRVDFADVGEMIGLTDLLHETRASKETDSMTPDEFMTQLAQEVAPMMEGKTPAGEGAEGASEHRAAMSPSLETHHMPVRTLVDTHERLQHRQENREEHDGELSNDEKMALELLGEERDRRGVEGQLRTAAGAGLDGHPSMRATPPPPPPPPHHPPTHAAPAADPDGDPDAEGDPEDEENEQFERIDDALDGLENEALAPGAEEDVEEIRDALSELWDVQGLESDDDAGEDDDAEPDAEAHFDSKEASHLGRAVTAAMRPGPAEPSPFAPRHELGVIKTAAQDLPLDLFGIGVDRYTNGEQSLAALAVSRGPERQNRLTGQVSPRLVDAAAGELRKALGALRRFYTIESYDLERFVSEKIASTDGGLIDGEFIWNVRLADHTRNRRGAVDLVLKIAGGAPLPGVQVLTDGRRLSFTRAALDQHLNVRRDATVAPARYSHVERALLEE